MQVPIIMKQMLIHVLILFLVYPRIRVLGCSDVNSCKGSKDIFKNIDTTKLPSPKLKRVYYNFENNTCNFNGKTHDESSAITIRNNSFYIEVATEKNIRKCTVVNLGTMRRENIHITFSPDLKLSKCACAYVVCHNEIDDLYSYKNLSNNTNYPSDSSSCGDLLLLFPEAASNFNICFEEIDSGSQTSINYQKCTNLARDTPSGVDSQDRLKFEPIISEIEGCPKIEKADIVSKYQTYIKKGKLQPSGDLEIFGPIKTNCHCYGLCLMQNSEKRSQVIQTFWQGVDNFEETQYSFMAYLNCPDDMVRGQARGAWNRIRIKEDL